MAAIRAPLFGDRRKRMLEDIAILTGGEVITAELGLRLENTRLDQLGRRKASIITKDGTTILDGAGDPEADQRPRQADKERARGHLTRTTTAQKLNERLAKLAGGVAVIKVGAATETRAEGEASTASRTPSRRPARPSKRASCPAAAWRCCTPRRPVADLIDSLDGDERTGAKIVHRALEEPIKQIAVNAGADGSIVAERVRNRDGNVGFNALTGEYEDLVSAGIIDPAMVTRSALQNAASIGALIVTTEVVVAEPPEGSVRRR